MPATQSPAIVDSGNYLDEQHSQWFPDILDNPLFSSFSDCGYQALLVQSKVWQTNQAKYIKIISNSSNLQVH